MNVVSGGNGAIVRLIVGACAWLGIAGAAVALPSTKIGTASLVSPSAADSYFGSATTNTNSTSVSARPAEIQELARALKRDPDLIYEYVRNNTAIVWTYGLTKGGMGVIVDRAGTAFDQAHLMVELLRQSGYTAYYNLGTITLSGAQFQAWSGLTSATATCQLLSSGGIPTSINGTTTANCAYGAATVSTIDIAHSWVAVTISGVTYSYDPAYKDHTFTTGVNLATATGTSTGALMGVTATTGTESSISFAHTVASVSTNLLTATTALETAVNTALPAASVADIVGGQSINPQTIPSGGIRQTSLPYTTNVLRTITGEMPNQYRTSLRVQIGKVRPSGGPTGVIDKLVYVDEIYGRRLVFDPNFDTSGATFNGALNLVDEFGAVNSLASTGSYSDNPSFSKGDVTLTVNLPYAASSGTYMDAVVTRTLTYALPFTITHGWGDQGRGLIDKFGQRRDTAMPAIPDTSCKACYVAYKNWKGDGRRELISAEWLAQASRGGRLHAAIAKSIFAQHYSVGVVASDTNVIQTPNGSWWINDAFDRVDIETGFSLTSATASTTDRRAAVLATAQTLAMLKGNVASQVSGAPDYTSVATRFDWGNLPESGTDNGGYVSRKVYSFTTSAEAASAMSLAKTESNVTTPETGIHGEGWPVIGNTETVARRQQVGDAIVAYAGAGFTVFASGEALLGGGGRATGLVPYSGSTYTHIMGPQRGGAIAAAKYDSGGDPIEVAQVLVNPTGVVDGGGATGSLFHQAQYDPPTAADVVKGRFVNPPIGMVTAVSPAKVVVGKGDFPYALTGQLVWRDGEARDETYGSAGHREPQSGWTTPYNNMLSISGSGLEAMGESDARAAFGTVAVFYGLQDVYKSSPSSKREIVAAMVGAWWGRTLQQNVATVSVGTTTRQFIRKPSAGLQPNGSFFSPGPGSTATLVQTGTSAFVAQHPASYTNCSLAIINFVSVRGWGYSGVSFALTGPTGDVQTFAYWSNQLADTSTTTCAKQAGFRMTSWAWPSGAALTYNYTTGGVYPTVIDRLSHVTNNVGQRLNFTNNGLGGFTNNLTGTDLRQVTVSQAGSVILHTDPISAVSKFDISTLGTGDFVRTKLVAVYGADDGSTPALQNVFDTLGRLAQARDRFVQAGSRAATQYLLANGLRREVVDALGYSSVAYADVAGNPIHSIRSDGAISSAIYDGRGRPITQTNPDGLKVQSEYNSRNLVTKRTILAKVGSIEGGARLVTETGWDATKALASWTKDAMGAQTDYTYSGGKLTSTLYPPATVGATRISADASYYSNGLTLGVSTAMGRDLAATYSGPSFSSLADAAGSPVGNSTFTLNAQGDPTAATSPRGGVSTITYDALRRPLMTVGPMSGSSTAIRGTYDLLGRVTKIERGAYVSSAFTAMETYTAEFDLVGNKVKETSPAGVTQYSYDALNRPVCTAVRMNASTFGSLPTDACQQSPSGPYGPDRISRVTYDAAGRVVQSEIGVGTSLQQVSSRSAFTLNGLPATLTDANGNMTTYEYDGFNRLVKLRYPAAPRGSRTSSATDYEGYGYDANGNRTAHRKRDGTTIAYTYDALNRLAVKDLPGGMADDVYYSYSDDGRTTKGRLGSSTNTSFYQMVFDTAGRLTSDTASTPITGGTLVTGYTATFNAGEGFRSTAQFGEIAASYTYDLAVRPTNITGGTLAPQVASFTYGPLDHLVSVARPNGTKTGLAYDSASRPISLSHTAPIDAGSSQTFIYTPGGQLASQTQTADAQVWGGQPVTTVNFTHDQLNRDAAIATALGYDANGNLISDGTRTFTYDAENRLRTVTGGPASTTLTYDAWGRLDTVTANGATTAFRYAGPSLVAEYALAGAAASTLQRSYVYGPGDQPLLQVGGDSAHPKTWFHQDRLGSVIATSNAGGAITPYTYGPYGEPQSWAGSRFRYTGQIAIPEAQLYHYRARVYDPMMGRFLQTDPIGTDGGINLYGYVGGDPVNLTDPSGLQGINTLGGVLVVPSTRPASIAGAAADAVDDFMRSAAAVFSFLNDEPTDSGFGFDGRYHALNSWTTGCLDIIGSKSHSISCNSEVKLLSSNGIEAARKLSVDAGQCYIENRQECNFSFKLGRDGFSSSGYNVGDEHSVTGRDSQFNLHTHGAGQWVASDADVLSMKSRMTYGGNPADIIFDVETGAGYAWGSEGGLRALGFTGELTLDPRSDAARAIFYGQIW